jgi:4-hydroxy-3-methylbut-2-en-1-yl diphosphate reductase
MEILIAKSAGFCFGVDQAVNKIEKLIAINQTLNVPKPLYTYGPIIHNPHVVDNLKKRHVNVIAKIEELPLVEKGTILIRSHGVTFQEMKEMKDAGFEVVDSTCPYVKKIHRIVQKASKEGHEIIIVGSKAHPEVVGISGWSLKPVQFIEELEDVDEIELEISKTYCVVAQTTFNHNLYEGILNKLQKKGIRVIINETICAATVERQIEANELSKRVTKMLVIGGKDSSNTRKLYEICKRQCKDTYYIETIEDLVLNVFTVNDIIGITAGASTPKNIIEEVISNVRNAEF